LMRYVFLILTIYSYFFFFFSNLTLNQAFHPFYMFQVASLLLWSMDEYYYYAVCIFLISVFSIGTTVLETRSVCFYAYPVLYLYRLTWCLDYASPERDLLVRLRCACSQEWIL
jgi:hypothetical protein